MARRFYYTKELSRNYISRNTLQEIFSAIFLSAVLHAIWIRFATWRGELPINYELLLKLLFSPNKVTDTDYIGIDLHTGNIFRYFFTLSCASIFFGFFAKFIVRTLRLDRKIDYLRYDNKWYYLISSQALDIDVLNVWRRTNPKLISKNIGSIRIKVSLRSDSKSSYEGLLVDYQLAENNSLDYIVLTDAKKTIAYAQKICGTDKLVLDRNSNPEYLYLTEQNDNFHFFVIPYADILNLNFQYVIEERSSKIQEAWKVLKSRIRQLKKRSI